MNYSTVGIIETCLHCGIDIRQAKWFMRGVCDKCQRKKDSR